MVRGSSGRCSRARASWRAAAAPQPAGPGKSTAWGRRPLAWRPRSRSQAPRCCQDATGFSHGRSRARESFHRGGHLRSDRRLRRAASMTRKRSGLRRRFLREVVGAHPLQKASASCSDAILRATLFRPGQTLSRQHINKASNRASSPRAPRQPTRQSGKDRGPAPTLIGTGGVREAIAKHPGPGGEGRLNTLLHMLRSSREHQQKLRLRSHGLPFPGT